MKDSSALQIFNYESDEVRTIVNEQGEIWFAAADVCKILDIANSRDAVSRLDEDERGTVITDTPGGPQGMSYINESGLYELIFTSRKPEAKAFKRWVTHEVLPAIRKTGSYSVHQQQPALQGPSKQGSIEESMDRFTAELAALRKKIGTTNRNADASHHPKKVSRSERRALTYADYSDASIKARCLTSLLKLAPGWHDRREVLNVGDPVLNVLGLQYTGGVLNVLSRDGILLRRGGNGHNALYRLRD